MSCKGLEKVRTAPACYSTNGAGDDFGKSFQEDWKSTSWFLGDELGKGLGDEYGKRFSPDFSGLMKW
jgi:hypothetical protein